MIVCDAAPIEFHGNKNAQSSSAKQVQSSFCARDAWRLRPRLCWVLTAEAQCINHPSVYKLCCLVRVLLGLSFTKGVFLSRCVPLSVDHVFIVDNVSLLSRVGC